MSGASGRRVFLAGATGLVGSAIARALVDSDPRTQVRGTYFSRAPFFLHERVQYVQADLTSQAECRSAVRGCDCAIMAAAADAAGAAGLRAQPWDQVTANTVMNARMLEAFHAEGVRLAIYIGSVTLYQEFNGFIAEDDLDLNRDPHPAYLGIGWVHRFNEKLCRFWHESTGVRIAIARAANVFGPHARFDPRNANFVPALIRKAVDRMEPFEAWGNADVTRDVIYSEDFARAVVMMLDAESIEFDVFNVGSGVKTTVGEVVSWALRFAGHAPREVTYAVTKPTTNQIRALDCSKIRRVLGWQPRYSVEEGIRRTTQWWIDNRRSWTK